MITRLKDTLLLVGDGDSDRSRLREIFEDSYHLLEAEHASQASLLLEQNLSCIAAVLADIPLSDPQEISTLRDACRPGTSQEVPLILFITPVATGKHEEHAFSMGATDVVRRPYTASGVHRRVQVLIDLYLHRWQLESLVKEQSETIRNTNQVMLDALSAIIEHRNTESGNHILRIRRFTKILLQTVARVCPEYGLTDTAIESIASASALHDIGKISIPDSILNKPGPLTPEEFSVMQTHTTVGSQLVTTLSGISDVDYLRYAYNIALYHHERWDGKGYPRGLKGDDIPICAQVVGLADAFDALTTPRVYKPAFSHDRAINMILNGECGLFSSRLLECFKHVRAQFSELATQYADGYSPKADHIMVPLPGPVWHRPKLDSLQLSQVKYQTILHHINDTVIEFDLDAKLYHVVYNPDPSLETLILDAPFEEVINRLIHNGAHPDDRQIALEIQRCFLHDFFQQELRKKTFHFRIYNPLLSDHLPYEITLLRLNTLNKDQRIVFMILHRLESIPPETAAPADSTNSASVLYGLSSSTLCCRHDGEMSIESGIRELYPLTGYTEGEIAQTFGAQYLNLVHPDDRDAFSRCIQALSSHSGHLETEYRLARKDGTYLWVMDKSRAQIGADGRKYIYHAIYNNTRGKQINQELQRSLARTQLILDQFEDIVFDWNLTTDELICSDRWMQRFGHAPASKNYSVQLGVATHFHPDDLALVRSHIAAIQTGTQSHTDFEVRIVNNKGRYLWNKIRATIQRSETGTPIRIIGIISDIDELKRIELSLKEQAERDSLTKLLNKASTQQMISDHLAHRKEATVDALLVLDMDNFKAVNDNYGHMYGDAVLSQVGQALKNLFRSDDIIGRIGGDEFLVFLKDIPGESLLINRCEMLLENFHSLFSDMIPGLAVSFSIGAATAPAHGTSFADLFQHADEALYTAKSLGKNTYVIYDPKKLFGTMLSGAAHVPTRIDSDERPGMADTSFVRFVFHRLYESSNIPQTINELMAYVGEQFNVSRVYIFENNYDNTTCSNTFEWCNREITPEIGNLQNISYITDIPGWPELFNERGVFYCTDITKLAPHFRTILEPQNIKSMLQCSILDNNVFRGYVGFDDCAVHRFWTQEQIDLLQFLSEVFALFLLKHRTQNRPSSTPGVLLPTPYRTV